MTSAPKSGNDSVSLTGPVASLGGTAGHLPAGYAVREFQIDRVLGEGGFSVVYLATDTRLERQVAIKEYMPTALATRNADLSVHVRSSAQHREAFEAGLRSFINEAKLLARFEHRALVKVHQFWQEKGTAYMVMPYYSGPTLKSWIRQQHEPVDATWLEQFLRLVMDALETLHRENCLHRDVAPDNILILNERSPLLLDFGAARRVIGDLTQALTVILKPGFAPIEQYAESQSMRQGPWTDVYALCAVAHFMITGRAPTPSVTRVLADDLVPLGTLAAGRFPPAFLAALDAGLTVRPQQRPQSIGALREMMNGTAPEDNTLTAPPGAAAPLMGGPVPTTFGPVPTTIRPLTPTISPEAAAVAADDDDKTRIVTTRDFPLRTSPSTISSPEQPAVAPAESDTSAPVDADAGFGTRLPSRSMREHEPTAAPTNREPEDDKASALPLIIGGVAIAAVIGGAWALINWMNREFDAARKSPPVSAAVPAPAPAPKAPPAPAATPPVQTAAATPKPVTAPPAAAAANVAPASNTTPPSSGMPPSTAARSSNPASSSNVTSSEKAAPASSAANAPPASNATPAALALEPRPSGAPPSTAAARLQSALPAGANAKGADKPPPSTATPSTAAPSAASNTKTTGTDKPVEKPAARDTARTSAPATTAPSASAGKVERKPEPASTATSPSPSMQTATNTAGRPDYAAKGAPAAPADARPASAPLTASPSKSGAPANTDAARARRAGTSANPAPPTPMSETQVAAPVYVPPVTTVDAAPPPVAAVEPARATPPAAAAAPPPLRVVSKPDPMFPREALRADVDKGRVKARLHIASDGTVSRVEILAAHPARVFEREVRETAMRWRFDPPGQPRQTDVEFVFDRFKDR